MRKKIWIAIAALIGICCCSLFFLVGIIGTPITSTPTTTISISSTAEKIIISTDIPAYTPLPTYTPYPTQIPLPIYTLQPTSTNIAISTKSILSIQPTAKNTEIPTQIISTPIPTVGRTGAKCNDGSYSNSIGKGACSGHKGVECWYYSDGSCFK